MPGNTMIGKDSREFIELLPEKNKAATGRTQDLADLDH